MPYKKSPGGSIFPYSYKGGELFGLHMGEFGADEAAAISRLKADAAFFAEQNHGLGLWIDFYGTKLTDQLLGELIKFLEYSRKHILKLGLYGCSPQDRRKIDRLIKEARTLSTLPIKYFNDPEAAKTWLVSER
jgi:hypothetical protein